MTALAAFIGIVLIVVAIPFGLTVHVSDLLLALLLLGLVGLMLSAASNAIALKLRSEDALAPLMNGVAQPMLLLSGILLPMSIPIVMVCLIWQFTQIWNDFLFGVVFASGDAQPITVALNNLVNTSTGAKEYNVDMAAAMIAGLPTLLVYIFAGKYFLRGLTSGAVKG